MVKLAAKHDAATLLRLSKSLKNLAYRVPRRKAFSRSHRAWLHHCAYFYRKELDYIANVLQVH